MSLISTSSPLFIFLHISTTSKTVKLTKKLSSKDLLEDEQKIITFKCTNMGMTKTYTRKKRRKKETYVDCLV